MPTSRISDLQVTYPDFKLNTTIDPEEFDQNNADIMGRVNEAIQLLNAIQLGTEDGLESGADLVHTFFNDIEGGTSLQDALNTLKDSIDAHTVDISNRVVVGGNHTGTWQGLTPSTMTDETVNGARIDLLEEVWGSVDPKSFGAIGDGVADDTAPVREAISLAESLGLAVSLTGIYLITGELEIKKTLTMYGTGSGEGYTSAGIAGYKQLSGFLVKGTGAKRIRTRRVHRSVSTDPQDAPLSVALNVQAEGVKLKDFSVFLYFDQTDALPDNFGDDWDVGVFVGCRTHFKTDNLHVMGYWREASCYFDVTHATNMPRFNDLDGNPYDNGVNTSGGDGCTMYKTMLWGGKWGIRVAGAIKHDTNTDYYDDLQDALVSDFRGSFGFSDFTTQSCSVYGTDHHSDTRRNTATGDYLTDTAGGAMYVDGHANNANQSVWGHRHFSSRFASFEPFRVKLDHAARVQFYGCHIEQRSGTVSNFDGTPVLFDNTDTYGFVSGTANTDHVLLIGSNIGAIDSAFMPTTVRCHNWFPSGTSTGSRTTDPIIAGHFESIAGELDLRSATSGDAIRFRNGSNSRAILNAYGFAFQSGVSNPRVASGNGELELRSATSADVIRFATTDRSFATVGQTGLDFDSSVANPTIASANGDLDLRANADGMLRGRVGGVTRLTISGSTTNLYGTTQPATDATQSLGASGRQWKDVTVVDGVIVRTPDGTKQYLISVDNTGALTTTLV